MDLARAFGWVVLPVLLSASCKAPPTTSGKKKTAQRTLKKSAPSDEGPLPPVHTAAGPEADNPVLDKQLREEQRTEALKLAEVYPESDDALYLVGLIFDEQGNVKEALKYWKKSLELDPSRYDALESIGRAYYRLGQYERAENFLKRALDLNPNLSSSRKLLSKVLLNQGKAAEAAKLLKGRATTPGEWQILGEAFQQLKKPTEAKKAYLQAIKLRPNFAEAYYGLARVCALLGEKEQAKKYQEKFREHASYKQVEGRQVRSVWNPLVITKVSCAHSLTDVGRVYAFHGNMEEAERLWQRAREIDPKNVTCRLKLALLYQRRGRVREAIELYKEVCESDPRHGLYYLNVGNLYARLRDFNNAEEAYKKVVQLAPSRSEGYFALAQLYLNWRRNQRQALSLAQKAVKIAPLARNYAVLARAYYACGKPDQALEAAQKAVSLDPKNAVFRRVLEGIRKNLREGKK